MKQDKISPAAAAEKLRRYLICINSNVIWRFPKGIRCDPKIIREKNLGQLYDLGRRIGKTKEVEKNAGLIMIFSPDANETPIAMDKEVFFAELRDLLKLIYRKRRHDPAWR